MFNFDSVKRNAAGVPFVILGGKEWIVPPLPIGKVKVIVPALMDLIAHVAAYRADGGTTNVLAVLSGLNEELLDKVIRAVHAGVSHATPLSLEAFLSLVITPDELFLALPTIALQTGVIKEKKEEQATGEAPAQA